MSFSTGMTHACARYYNRKKSGKIGNDNIDELTEETGLDLTINKQEHPQSSANSISCWGGHNEFGQLNIPVYITNGSLGLAVGDEHTCA